MMVYIVIAVVALLVLVGGMAWWYMTKESATDGTAAGSQENKGSVAGGSAVIQDAAPAAPSAPAVPTAVEGLFDGAAYVRYYPDLKAKGFTPDQGRLHFANNGIAERRVGFVVGQPYGGRWDDAGYLSFHADVPRDKYSSGAAHFKSLGWKENRKVRLVVDRNIKYPV